VLSLEMVADVRRVSVKQAAARAAEPHLHNPCISIRVCVLCVHFPIQFAVKDLVANSAFVYVEHNGFPFYYSLSPVPDHFLPSFCHKFHESDRGAMK
jgi:hypothetical protein